MVVKLARSETSTWKRWLQKRSGEWLSIIFLRTSRNFNAQLKTQLFPASPNPIPLAENWFHLNDDQMNIYLVKSSWSRKSNHFTRKTRIHWFWSMRFEMMNLLKDKKSCLSSVFLCWFHAQNEKIYTRKILGNILLRTWFTKKKEYMRKQLPKLKNFLSVIIASMIR